MKEDALNKLLYDIELLVSETRIGCTISSTGGGDERTNVYKYSFGFELVRYLFESPKTDRGAFTNNTSLQHNVAVVETKGSEIEDSPLLSSTKTTIE